MYRFDSRVRFSETDYTRKMTPASIINYFQDCTNFESEHLKIGMDYLQSIHRAWVLSFWEVEFFRFPQECETITTSTWPYDFKGMYGYRNFSMNAANGGCIARANSLWVLLDTEEKHPVRVDELVTFAYELAKPLPMGMMNRKIPIPDKLTAYPPIQVHRFNLDLFMHLNNGQYIRFAQEYVPCDRIITKMRAEYKRSALFHDTLIPLVHLDENSVTVVLADEAKSPYAVVTFELA